MGGRTQDGAHQMLGSSGVHHARSQSLDVTLDGYHPKCPNFSDLSRIQRGIREYKLMGML